MIPQLYFYPPHSILEGAGLCPGVMRVVWGLTGSRLWGWNCQQHPPCGYLLSIPSNTHSADIDEGLLQAGHHFGPSEPCLEHTLPTNSSVCSSLCAVPPSPVPTPSLLPEGGAVQLVRIPARDRQEGWRLMASSGAWGSHMPSRLLPASEEGDWRDPHCGSGSWPGRLLPGKGATH